MTKDSNISYFLNKDVVKTSKGLICKCCKKPKYLIQDNVCRECLNEFIKKV